MQDVEIVCSECGAEGMDNFRKNGFKYLYQRKVQLYQCKRCGRIIQGQSNSYDKTVEEK